MGIYGKVSDRDSPSYIFIGAFHGGRVLMGTRVGAVSTRYWRILTHPEHCVAKLPGIKSKLSWDKRDDFAGIGQAESWQMRRDSPGWGVS